jgi:hypothetical protein
VDCHAAQDEALMAAHLDNYGEDCLACHDGVDRMENFDHLLHTNFPLTGAHLETSCADCHSGAEFKTESSDCAGCHAEPDQHLGTFDPTCDACHTPSGWSPAILDTNNFAHRISTGFNLIHHSLDFAENPIACFTCHQDDSWNFAADTCLVCHGEETPAAMDQHLLEYGPRCLDCHDGADRMRSFDHAHVFPLLGKHAEITCDGCHFEQVWTNTKAICASCHEEPEIHLAVFGQQCQYCHIPEGWTPAPLRRHRFPLEHGVEAPSDCETCHQENYSTYTCFGCHEHEQAELEVSHLSQGIPGDEFPLCMECHIAGEIEESR